MTKKDYELIAYAFNNSRIMILQGDEQPTNAHDELELQGWAYAVKEMALQLSKTNPRFDRERFVTACGGKEHEDAMRIIG